MIYIFDIDGTVADLSHRLHYIESEPKNWAAFYAACPEDKPIVEVIRVAQALQGHNSLAFITGRSDEVREQTWRWLRAAGLCPWELLMRKAGDHRQDSVVKGELLGELLSRLQLTLKWVAGVFEDRRQVVDMYRALGLKVFQVADGNF